MSAEKRIYQRIVVNLPAQCAVSAKFQDSFPVLILDIGPEGVGFLTGENLEPGTHVYFQMDLGGGNSAKLAAKVCWSKPFKDNERFRVGAGILETEQEAIEKFVRFYCEKLIPTATKTKKILVIEDEIDMAGLLRLELTQNNYDVVCAYDGQDGFAKYLSERPDLIILDVMLPKLNGYEVCRKIRREQGDGATPIVMLTAKKGEVDRIVGGVVGAQKYLTKPFEAEELLREIKRLLEFSKK